MVFGLLKPSAFLSVANLKSTATVAGISIAGTSIAGVGFAWLRLRSGSLLAPVLAHIATNSFSIVTAWAVLH